MRKVLLLAVGLLLGLAGGASLALYLNDGHGSQAAQGDACFGRGELLRSWAYTVSSDGVENARLWGGDLTAGEQREARECRVSPIEVVTLDGPTGQVLRTQHTLEYAIQYYAAHPEEQTPGEKLIDEAERVAGTVHDC